VQAILGPVQCGHGGGLADRGGVGSRLALQLIQRFDERHGGAGEANAPAGHGIGFRAAVHRKGAVTQAGFDLDDGGRFEAIIGQFLIDIVGKHPDIGVFQQNITDWPQLLGRIGRTGGIVGGVEEYPFGFGRDRRLQIFRAQLESVILAAGNKDRGAFGQR
jgi:hypothetical protein